MHHKRHHLIRKADLMTCEIVFSVFFKLQIKEDGQRWNDKQTMRLVRRLHSFAIGHVYIFPIEALAKVYLKRDGASQEKLVMWNRWGKNNRGISDGCQSSGFKCVLITTQTMLCNSGACKGRIFHGCVCEQFHARTCRQRRADRDTHLLLILVPECIQLFREVFGLPLPDRLGARQVLLHLLHLQAK